MTARSYGVVDFNAEIDLTVSIIPDELKESLWRHATPREKACYRNVLAAIDFLRNGINNTEPMGYVLGFMSVGSVPIEHCILQVGNNYYDPTLEYQGHNVEDLFFLPVRTLSEAYAINLCRQYQHAPDLMDVIRSERQRSRQ